MTSVDFLIVGAGPAGVACAVELRARGASGSILLVGREPETPYERPPITKGYLAGTMSREQCLLHPLGFYEEQGIELRTRVSVMKLDTEARVAKLSAGGEVGYGAALLAPGANVRRLRVDGGQLEGIHYLRALGNADALRADASGAERAVLIGGSYIAAEVAATLTGLGVACTMVMLEDRPLSTGFGDTAGRFFEGVLRSHGIELVTGDGLARFEGSERVERVVTESGRTLDADLVVMGTGAMPDTMLARSAGLELGETGGIRCDAALRTSAPGVWAAGDACEFDGVRIEHWEVASAQGAHAARGMLGSDEPFSEVPYFWSDLADWCTAEYVGWPRPHDREEVSGSPDDGSFSISYLAGDTLTAALVVNAPDDLARARERLSGEG